jgi:hypothetical protein
VSEDLGPLYDMAELSALIPATKARAEAEHKPPPKNPDEAGGRNNYFTSRAGTMRRAGFEQDAILAALRAENVTKGYETPDRELVSIARSVGSYEIGEANDPGWLDAAVAQGIINQGIRVDAVGRYRHLATGSIAGQLTPELLVDLIWNDLRKIRKVSAEDIARIVRIETHRTREREGAVIRSRILGRPEVPEALDELRKFVVAVAGTADMAVVGGFLQFIWCVKRSLAGLMREHDIMPVLYNRIQGNGKSTAVRHLVGPMAELVDFINVETLADERKRPDLGKFVVGIWDEMEGADKRDTDAIKNALSSQTVSYRPMRTNDNVTMPRLMNFIGTSNKPLAAMVRDSSGNRRFVEIETLAKLDHDAINAINYPLLWQAVSENAAAPAKCVLGEIRAHQAVGRFQDSVQMWLEYEDVEPGKWATTEDWRGLYVTWCETAREQPISNPLFATRLKGEGFTHERPRLENGTRPHGYRAPGGIAPKDPIEPDSTPVPPPDGPGAGPRRSTDGPETVHLKTSDSQDISMIGPLDHQNIKFSGKQGIFPERQNPLDQTVHGPQTVQAQPWPKAPGGHALWVYDLEVFPNRFMFSAFNGCEWVEYDETNIKAMAEFVRDRDKVFAGFNNHGYDDVIIGALAADARERYPNRIYQLSTRIIEPKDQAEKDANFRDRYKGRPWAYSIDVFQLLNAKGSLKEWECRIGFRTVVESPAPFDKPLPADQVDAVRQYCRNDVLATAQILLSRWPLVELRETLADTFRLGKRAYALSEQGLAQATFLELHRQRTGERSGKVREAAAAAPENQADRFPMAEVISDRVAYSTLPFAMLLERLRHGSLVRDGSWGIELEGKPLDETFPLAGVEVSLGVGGLHTVDKPGTFVATADTAIVDLDVTSYYPSLMISERVFPSQIGEDFLGDLAEIRTKRVEAKKAGDKATSEALKIVLNATFGKLNDNWSPIRSVRNAFRVTMNGQLFLLMLIEALHSAGYEILSANTDGVTIRAPRNRIGAALASVTEGWEKATGMGLERTLFARVCRRDVNTYIALSEGGGKVKSKGAFNPESGKGDGRVIRDAAIAYLLHGIDPAVTVARETDPVAFLFYMRAKNGGTLECGDTHLGKTARWYAGDEHRPPLKRKNPDGSFDTIPNGHHAALALDITGWTVAAMGDLDRGYYAKAAWELIRETNGWDRV